jgi:hypothetical protein
MIADALDPLTLKPGARILPATSSDFEAGGGLLVLFWMKGLPDSGEKPPALDLSVTIADAQSHAVPLPTTILFFGKEASGGYRTVARVDTASLIPGTYSLKLSAGLAGSDEPPARHAVTFTLHAKDKAAATTSSSAGAP